MKRTSTTSSLVKALRRDLALSQEQLAERLGVSRFSVLRWENEQAQPHPLALRAIKEFRRANGVKP